MKNIELELRIKKLNERGYGVANHSEKGDILVLNTLPEELVKVRIFRKKKGSLLGTAEQIIEKSECRVEPKDDHFTSSSPWQIMKLTCESKVKKSLIAESFAKNGVELGDFEIVPDFVDGEEASWNYRNKVEFGFYGDDQDRVTISFFMRDGNFGKFPIYEGSSIVKEKMNRVAYKIVDYINSKGIKARQLKGLLLRYSDYTKSVVAALYVKDEELQIKKEEVESLVDGDLTGLLVIYSTRKSPANVVTNELVRLGETDLVDEILNTKIMYSYDGFFQVNTSVFELAAKDMVTAVADYSKNIGTKEVKLVDLYAGVGTIGLILAKNIPTISKVLGIEIFPTSRERALANAKLNGVKNYEFVETAAEDALEFLTDQEVLIVDPPRAGLHQKVVDRIKEVKPKFLVYLSCNYQTQAENLAQLLEIYKLKSFKAYNFYPHTPHVETLAVLELK